MPPPNARRGVTFRCAGRDSRSFFERLHGEYLPSLALPAGDGDTPEDAVYRELRDPQCGAPPEGLDLDAYPAHLHIDLVERATGRGFGSALVTALLDALRAAGAPGVHLQMHEGNVRARRFYERLGFAPLPTSGGSASGGAFFMGVRF